MKPWTLGLARLYGGEGLQEFTLAFQLVQARLGHQRRAARPSHAAAVRHRASSRRPRVIIKLRCEGRAYVHNNRHPTDRRNYGDDASTRDPVTILVNESATYSSDDFDVWAFSDVTPTTIYKDIVSEDGSQFTRRASKQDLINNRHAFRV